MFKRFLFSKIGLSLAIALLIIGLGASLKYAKRPKSGIRQTIDMIAESSIKNAIETGQIDTTDWEEALRIANGSSTIDEKIAELQKSAPLTEEEEKSLTATDRFTRALMEKYVKYKNSGGIIDENTSIRFVNDLLTQDYGGPDSEKVYTLTDITLIDPANLSDIRKYGNSLGAALSQPVSSDYENEIVLVNKVYETDDPQYLDKLPENLQRYRKIRSLAASIAVPKGLKDAHIALLNSLSAIIEGVRGMMLIDEDPIAAAKMMIRYEEGLKSLDPSLIIVSNYLKKQNISYETGESGYLFLK
jgi:hypothetical protein